MKKIIYPFVLNVLLASTQFNTPWGNCIVENNQQAISDSIIQNLVLAKIHTLNSQFKKANVENKFSIIIVNGNEKIKNQYWDWSLGITYSKPEKIIT